MRKPHKMKPCQGHKGYKGPGADSGSQCYTFTYRRCPACFEPLCSECIEATEGDGDGSTRNPTTYCARCHKGRCMNMIGDGGPCHGSPASECDVCGAPSCDSCMWLNRCTACNVEICPECEKDGWGHVCDLSGAEA